jgi:two-component system, chemotaxis family, chemotaxis protein CheY
VPRRILVVEDSASTRSLVRAILEDPGFSDAVGSIEVTEAQSGFDAMRLLPRARYDLIITDINMPDVNGLELIHFIRRSEQYRSTPLVIISTQATERDVERGRKLGADAYVPKPFTAESLREACESLLLSSSHERSGVREHPGAAADTPREPREVPSVPPSGSGR